MVPMILVQFVIIYAPGSDLDRGVPMSALAGKIAMLVNTDTLCFFLSFLTYLETESRVVHDLRPASWP